MATLKANHKLPNDNGWQDRHNAAVMYPRPLSSESAVVTMLKGWAEYAEAHERQFESKIGDDCVLGQEWEAIGVGIRGLLNGETGTRLDCGTLDAFILDTLSENGMDTSQR